MKTLGKLSLTFTLAFVIVGEALAHGWQSPSRAHQGHRHFPQSSVQFGVYIGDPWFPRPIYPYPVYGPRVYVPAPVIIASPPPAPVYIERPAAPPARMTLEPGYWYYCGPAGAYYPNVQDCPGGWQKVAPQ